MLSRRRLLASSTAAWLVPAAARGQLAEQPVVESGPILGDMRIQRYRVGVIVKARHTCQCHRGVKKDGRMVTSALRGNFHRSDVRSEFLELVKLSNTVT
jgi:GTP cyclohydrolase I